MKINPKQLEAVLALPGAERYNHFIKVVADWQEVWGLYSDGWALASTDNGQQVFPMWPAKEYAEACAKNEWQGYEPKVFSLDDLMGELLPKLKKDGVLPGIFFTPVSKGVTPTVDQFINDLNIELENY
jgi:hypothetical protein